MDVKFGSCSASKRGQRRERRPAAIATLSHDLAQTLTPEFGDVCFECEGRQLWASKAVLCCRAAYFVGMFSSRSRAGLCPVVA